MLQLKNIYGIQVDRCTTDKTTRKCILLRMLGYNNLLLMKSDEKETILKSFVGTFGLKIVPTKAPMPRKNVAIKIEI